MKNGAKNKLRSLGFLALTITNEEAEKRPGTVYTHIYYRYIRRAYRNPSDRNPHPYHPRIRGRHIVIRVCAINEHELFQGDTRRQLDDKLPWGAHSRTTIEGVHSRFG